MGTQNPERLAERVDDHARAVIDAELRRLRGRAPGLTDTELSALRDTLDRVVNRLLLDRLRGHPATRALCDVLDPEYY